MEAQDILSIILIISFVFAFIELSREDKRRNGRKK